MMFMHTYTQTIISCLFTYIHMMFMHTYTQTFDKDMIVSRSHLPLTYIYARLYAHI